MRQTTFVALFYYQVYEILPSAGNYCQPISNGAIPRLPSTEASANFKLVLYRYYSIIGILLVIYIFIGYIYIIGIIVLANIKFLNY